MDAERERGYAELRRWFDSRRASLENARRPFEPLWRDIRELFEPKLGLALLDGDDPDARAAERGDGRIKNSEPRMLLSDMASGLQSGITNQARPWFQLRAKDEDAATGSAGVGRWLAEATRTIRGALERSNAYSAMDQMYRQLVFGTACAVVYPDEEADIFVQVLDCGAYYLAENSRGRVDTMMRRMLVTAAQMRQEFGDEALPQGARSALEAGRAEAWQKCYNLICPAAVLPMRVPGVAPGRPFASLYFSESAADGRGGLLAARSFGYNPILAPRWSVNGSVYGTGVGEVGLPEARSLMAVERAEARNVELSGNPAMLAPASMKGEPIKAGPGGVTFYNPGDGGRIPVTRLFETSQSVADIAAYKQEIVDRLRRIMFKNLFAMLLNAETSNRQKTATEVQEMHSEKVSLLGPVLTRLNTDFLSPFISAVYTILAERAAADSTLANPPAAIAGREIAPEFVSTLHTAQKRADMMNTLAEETQAFGMVAQVKPEILDRYSEESAARQIALAHNDEGLLLDDRAVKRLRQERAEAQAEARRREEEAAAAEQARAEGDAIEKMSRAAERGAARGGMPDETLAARDFAAPEEMP